MSGLREPYLHQTKQHKNVFVKEKSVEQMEQKKSKKMNEL